MFIPVLPPVVPSSPTLPASPIVNRAVPGKAIYRFGNSYDKSIGNIPGFYSSKSFTGEDASQRVKWRAIVFHGEGTLTANVYLDNVLLVSSVITMTELPSQTRVLNFPRGKSTGYKVRYDYTIETGYVRFAEIFYEPMFSDVN
jgi:hypothetical protein